MIAGSQIATLRNDCVVPYLDLSQGVEHDIIANPRVVPNRDLPRKGHPSRWPDDDISADFCPKHPQEQAPPGKHDLWRATKERALDNPPKLHDPR